jgi:Fe2+ transport system protein FeoA
MEAQKHTEKEEGVWTTMMLNVEMESFWITPPVQCRYRLVNMGVLTGSQIAIIRGRSLESGSQTKL